MVTGIERVHCIVHTCIYIGSLSPYSPESNSYAYMRIVFTSLFLVTIIAQLAALFILVFGKGPQMP